MYLKHYQLKQDPFPTHPDNQIFFPGGGREIVLQHVLEDLSSGMSLVHLCGEKGSGKTILCQLIRKKLRSPPTVVLLSAPSDTFDDKGRSFALTLGENDVKRIEEAKLYEKILRLISESADNGDSTLFIIDDAEELSPTVLTRILRLTYDVHQPQRGVQFVLAGRLPLGTNPEQFTAIRAEPLQQFTYTLQPLDRDDTARYLAFRLNAAGTPDHNHDSVFSAEAIARIHETTCGNICLINILAEEALRKSYKSKSFIVLLDHVKAPSDFSSTLPISISRPSEPYRTPRILVGLIALISIATIWAYSVVPVDTKLKQPIDGSLAAIQEVLSSLTKKLPVLPPAQTVPTPIPGVASEAVKIDTKLKQRVAGPSAAIQEALSSLTKKLPLSPPAQTVPPPIPGVASEAGENAQMLTEKDPEAKKPKTEMTKIVVLTADKTLKVRHKGEERIDMPDNMQTNVNLVGRLTTLELYQNRTIAGDPWIKGEKDGMYTLQLVVLKASDAETNLKWMLDEKRYRQQADNFYIFKKMSVPETIFVFYGEYKNLATARLSQKSIPAFLRAHQPYAISIKEAIAKIRK